MRGRPKGSVIRDRMQEIVALLGVSYGYEIYKAYTAAFSKINIRSMYYHLSKGVELGEFVLAGAKKEQGAYTWGDRTTRMYYVLGPEGKQTESEELPEVLKEVGLNLLIPEG